MNVSKDGKTLYFSDDEISNDVDGEKQVFVTKRINGKETHTKKETKPKAKKEQQSLGYDTFSFDNEIVIGVNATKKEEDKNSSKSKKSNKSSSKNSSKSKSKNKKEIENKENSVNNSKNSKKDNTENLRSQKTSKKETKKTQKIQYNKQDKKEKPKKKRHKFIIGIITAIILIAITTVIAFTTSLFNITSIKVTGNEKISSDTIISLSRFKKRRKHF